MLSTIALRIKNMHVGFGPRCFGKVLKHYGIEAKPEELAELARAAGNYGLTASAEAWTVEEMFEHGRDFCVRAILHIFVEKPACCIFGIRETGKVQRSFYNVQT
jgi:hypothetical protein